MSVPLTLFSSYLQYIAWYYGSYRVIYVLNECVFWQR